MTRDGFSHRAYIVFALARAADGLAEAAPGLAALLRYPALVPTGPISVSVSRSARIAVPASMAITKLASLPVVFGLYGTFLPLTVYRLLGTSRRHVVGPERHGRAR